MEPLQLFGLLSLLAGLVCYALEERYRWATFGFGVACVLGSIYGFLLKDAWPFGAVEAAWAGVAFRRWWLAG